MESRGKRLGAAAELTRVVVDFCPIKRMQLERAPVASQKSGLQEDLVCSCQSPCLQGKFWLPCWGSALEKCIAYPLTGLLGPLLSLDGLLHKKSPSIGENPTFSGTSRIYCICFNFRLPRVKKHRASDSHQFYKNFSTPYNDHHWSLNK